MCVDTVSWLSPWTIPWQLSTSAWVSQGHTSCSANGKTYNNSKMNAKLKSYFLRTSCSYISLFCLFLGKLVNSTRTEEESHKRHIFNKKSSSLTFGITFKKIYPICVSICPACFSHLYQLLYYLSFTPFLLRCIEFCGCS